MAEGKIKLQVQMFGGFAISFEGRNISVGKNKTAKYVQLLEIVWLCGEYGIQKDNLINILYDREEQSNISNSFNNLIYQMHKQLKKSGLPDYEYIVNRDGIFYTDENVDIESDAVSFISNVEKARDCNDFEEAVTYYKAAFEIYKSELLPELSTQEWVIIRSVQLQKMYSECVDALGKFYYEKKDFAQMHKVYRKAAALYPDDEWQIGEINALICMDMYKDAYAKYDETLRYYTDELGVTPSPELLECYDKMSRQVSDTPGKILQIRDDIIERRGAIEKELGRAYDCSYPSFIDAYHILSRNMERTGQSVYMMLLTLVDYEGKRIANPVKLENKSRFLQEAISNTLRQGDTYCKYSSSQYLLLLVGTSKESCKVVYRRVLNKLKFLAGPRTELEYSVVSLADLPERLAEAK
ncbi:bacterial transcriptional activator domain-containing protein [Butyrivibrio proteoclasticus]|uniref:bacterial transcriptional activator domain-containing protein n=1 Tax=Butyrivibrio proteoclasticus TaxID=43305 RepID=UPI00047E5BE7|nr:bacterial transcriptional activator domain-containing protein [Butyrivibrio proteoclasticus]